MFQNQRYRFLHRNRIEKYEERLRIAVTFPLSFEVPSNVLFALFTAKIEGADLLTIEGAKLLFISPVTAHVSINVKLWVRGSTAFGLLPTNFFNHLAGPKISN